MSRARSFKMLLGFLLAFAAASSTVYAEDQTGAAPDGVTAPAAQEESSYERNLRRWNSLSEEERRSFRERARVLGPEGIKGLRQDADTFRKMPAEDRERIMENHRKFNALPKEERRALREKYRRFEGMPREKRDEYRQRFGGRHGDFRNKQGGGSRSMTDERNDIKRTPDERQGRGAGRDARPKMDRQGDIRRVPDRREGQGATEGARAETRRPPPQHQGQGQPGAGPRQSDVKRQMAPARDGRSTSPSMGAPRPRPDNRTGQPGGMKRGPNQQQGGGRPAQRQGGNQRPGGGVSDRRGGGAPRR